MKKFRLASGFNMTGYTAKLTTPVKTHQCRVLVTRISGDEITLVVVKSAIVITAKISTATTGEQYVNYSWPDEYHEGWCLHVTADDEESRND